MFIKLVSLGTVFVVRKKALRLKKIAKYAIYWYSFYLGSVAGIVEHLALYPVDTLKVS